MDFIGYWRTWYVVRALVKLVLHFQLTESPFYQYFVKEPKAQALSQLTYDQVGLVYWEHWWTWLGWGRLPASPAAPELCRVLRFTPFHLPPFPDCIMSESTLAHLAYDHAAEEWRSKGTLWTVAIIQVCKCSYTSDQLGYFLCATSSVSHMRTKERP